MCIRDRPSYQANLDFVTPAAYSNIQGLNLEPGTYISIIGKDESSSYWKEVKKGVEQAVKDLNKTLGYSGEDKIKATFNAPDGEDIDEQVNILDEELADVYKRQPGPAPSIDAGDGFMNIPDGIDEELPFN